jgi:hypothetical protein
VIDEKRVLKASWQNPASMKVKNSSHAWYSPLLEDSVNGHGIKTKITGDFGKLLSGLSKPKSKSSFT